MPADPYDPAYTTSRDRPAAHSPGDDSPTLLNPTVASDLAHVWHPYTQHLGMAPPAEITRGEGAYLHTRDGRRILDMVSSWWVTLHGHGHPEIADAIAQQASTLEQVIFTGFTHEPAARLAAELVSVLPYGLNRVFYSDDGSTAVEAAIKMALQYHANRGQPRKLIVALEHAYHGDTFGAMSVSARSVFNASFDSYLFDVARIPAPHTGDTIAALRTLLESRGADIAALIVEPMLLGASGMHMYGADILRTMRELTAEYDTLLIADEVLTGFGRTGPLFACEHARITPDIICLSKGITGGFLPLGATVATEAIFESFASEDPRRTLFHGHSYTANPIACAAARVSLRLLDAGSQRRRHVIQYAHVQHLERLSHHPAVIRTRSLGTIAAFDLVGTSSYLNPIGRELAEFALARDILLRPLGNVVYLLPPYCTTADDLGHVYAVLDQFLASRA